MLNFNSGFFQHCCICGIRGSQLCQKRHQVEQTAPILQELGSKVDGCNLTNFKELHLYDAFRFSEAMKLLLLLCILYSFFLKIHY